MLNVMQPSFLKVVGCAVGLVLAGQWVHANVDGNPYATIVVRNPFALKDPPPPPPPPETTAPPVPMAKVTMTGLLSTFGEPRVLLEIVEEPGKGAGTPKKPILREGERLGPVEILAIDVVKNTVRIRNSGVETNITFEVAKSSGPTPGGPGVAGAPPAFTPPSMNPQANLTQPNSPTVISANAANAGGGVTLMGGQAAAANPAVPSALGATALGAADGGMRNITRPLRTEAPNYGNLPAMTKEQADLLIEANRLRNAQVGAPPLPPTSLTPLMEGLANENQPQQPPAPGAFPAFPTPRGVAPPGYRRQ